MDSVANLFFEFSVEKCVHIQFRSFCSIHFICASASMCCIYLDVLYWYVEKVLRRLLLLRNAPIEQKCETELFAEEHLQTNTRKTGNFHLNA